MKAKYSILIIITFFTVTNCSIKQNNSDANKENMTEEEQKIVAKTINNLEEKLGENNEKNFRGDDLRLFEDSPVWELAKAVEKEDINKIKGLSEKDSSLVSYQETRFGKNLLQWAVYTNRYQAAKALAEAGADPNLQSYNGTSAFIHAAEKSRTTDYLTLLLKYGGDVNAVARPTDGKNQYLKTPLIAASGSNLETVKILVEAGADINFYSEKLFRNAFHIASTRDKIDVIKYLLIEKKADFKRPLHVRINGDSLYLTNLLRNMPFKLDSESYKTKMEVVEYLKERGMNYWETEIPSHFYKKYPKEYLDRY